MKNIISTEKRIIYLAFSVIFAVCFGIEQGAGLGVIFGFQWLNFIYLIELINYKEGNLDNK